MGEMSHFMADQIVNNFGRRHNNAPVIINVAAGGTASPAGFGVFNDDRVNGAANLSSFLTGKVQKMCLGLFFQKINDPPVQKLRFAADNNPVVFQNNSEPGIGAVDNLAGLSHKRYLIAVFEAAGSRQPGQHVGNPVAVIFHKSNRFTG